MDGIWKGITDFRVGGMVFVEDGGDGGLQTNGSGG